MEKRNNVVALFSQKTLPYIVDGHIPERSDNDQALKQFTSTTTEAQQAENNQIISVFVIQNGFYGDCLRRRIQINVHSNLLVRTVGRTRSEEAIQTPAIKPAMVLRKILLLLVLGVYEAWETTLSYFLREDTDTPRQDVSWLRLGILFIVARLGLLIPKDAQNKENI